MSVEKTTIEQDALEYLRLMVQLQMQRSLTVTVVTVRGGTFAGVADL